MRFVASSLLVLSLAPAVAVAQGKRASPTEPASREPSRAATTDPAADVPKNMIPPAGKCRIWMRGVPAAQQPAPTDCTTALRQAPSNGVLVFGPALRDLSPFEARRNELRTQQAARERQAAARTGRDSGGRTSDTAATRRPSTATERGTNATARDGTPRETKAPAPKPRDPATRSPDAARRRPTREPSRIPAAGSSGASQRRPDPVPPPRQSRRPDRPE